MTDTWIAQLQVGDRVAEHRNGAAGEVHVVTRVTKRYVATMPLRGVGRIESKWSLNGRRWGSSRDPSYRGPWLAPLTTPTTPALQRAWNTIRRIARTTSIGDVTAEDLALLARAVERVTGGGND